MCIVSFVSDKYQPMFPTNPWNQQIALPYITPQIEPEPFDWSAFFKTTQLEELKTLIKEFKEALEHAKKLDILLKQPDCVDPEKAKLFERVKELEAQLKKFEKPKKKKK